MTSNSLCITASPCASPATERPRYFPRQIITPDDLTLEQDYFRNKLRRHNRLLHGWGVVCGAKVCPTPQSAGTSTGTSSNQPWLVTVTPGYVLGPYGDEIIIDCCHTVDLRTSGTSGVTGDPCVQPVDPWCSDVYVSRDPKAPLYVAVKYKECKTRPVRVQPIGCGCNDNSCEYSRLQDGYEIGILTSCPDAGAQPPSIEDLTKGTSPDCPDCPPQPWVVLAQVRVDADGTIASIDNCECRRTVISFGSFWWQCQSGQISITGVAPVNATVDPNAVPQGTTAVALNVTVTEQPGMGKPPTLIVSLGPGITISSFKAPVAGTQPHVLTFDVAGTAALGPRTLTVIADTGSEASLENAINIVPAPQAQSGGPGQAGSGQAKSGQVAGAQGAAPQGAGGQPGPPAADDPTGTLQPDKPSRKTRKG